MNIMNSPHGSFYLLKRTLVYFADFKGVGYMGAAFSLIL